MGGCVSLLNWLLIITLPGSVFSKLRYPRYTIIGEWEGLGYKEKRKVGERSEVKVLQGLEQRDIKEEAQALPKVHKPKSTAEAKGPQSSIAQKKPKPKKVPGGGITKKRKKPQEGKVLPNDAESAGKNDYQDDEDSNFQQDRGSEHNKVSGKGRKRKDWGPKSRIQQRRGKEIHRVDYETLSTKGYTTGANKKRTTTRRQRQ